MSMPTKPESVECGDCGRSIAVETEPDEKPDGTILRYLVARCPQCGNVMDEEDIEEAL